MFTQLELQAITAMCDAEIAFLTLVAKRGLGTDDQIALVSALKVKAKTLAAAPPPPAQMLKNGKGKK